VTDKKQKKIISTSQDCPVVGSVSDLDQLAQELVLSGDFCDGWCPNCEQLLDCPKVWSKWNYRDLFAELNRLDLEDEIDSCLEDVKLDSSESLGTVLVRCEIFAPQKRLPPQLQHFIKMLKKLIQDTQNKLDSAFNEDNQE